MITIICDDCEMVYEIEAAEMEECHGCASPDDFRVASDRDLEDMEPFWNDPPRVKRMNRYERLRYRKEEAWGK